MTDAVIDAWLAKDPDPATRAELQALRAEADSGALAERFDGRVGFGTAGLRALMGAGPTRMNRLVIQESTIGLGHYVRAQHSAGAKLVAVVGFDGRHQSRAFAEDTSCVLVTLGFDVHLFDREIPTPVAGFAVRQLNAAIGIVITASHNPPGYNGYKVYWANGAQIIGPHDTGIARAIDVASTKPLLALEPVARHRETGAIRPLGQAMEEAYLAAIFALLAHPAPAHTTPLRVAYTPLHGVGARFADAAAAQMPGITLHHVASQKAPDGDFPTVRFPNPEEAGAMDAVLAYAADIDADIALANDPDADRLALAVRMADGTFQMLSGNALGALLGDDRLQQAEADDVVATTIVSSRMLSRMAKDRGVAYFETLTGFKWIANGAIARRALGQRLIFGYEEALGYILGELVWDKDGISALVAVCRLAQRLKAQNSGCLAQLEALYRRYGLHLTHQHTLAMTPAQSKRIGAMLRAQPPKVIDGRQVVHIDDLTQHATDDAARAARLATEPAQLPKSDVLIYTLTGDARIIVRPSGTEPKIKCYYELRAPLSDNEDVAQAQAMCRDALNRLCANHQLQLQALLAAQAASISVATASTPQTGR